MANQKLDRCVIEKLVGEENWVSWKFDINLHLSVNKLHGIVTGEDLRPSAPPPGASQTEVDDYRKRLQIFEERDAMVRYIIGSSVSSDPKRHILTTKTGKDMWDILHSVYEQKNERRLDLLYCQLFTYNKDNLDDIATHVSKLQTIWQQLNEELKDEGKLPESLLMNRILNTLPNDYLEFKNAWESVPKCDRSIVVLMERLRLHEQRLKEFKQCTSFSETTLLSNKHKLKCSHCGKLGHLKKKCFALKKLKSQSRSQNVLTKVEKGDAFVGWLLTVMRRILIG